MSEKKTKKDLLLLLKYISLLDLTKKDLKVFLYMLHSLDYIDYTKINHQRIASDLNIAKSDVSIAIKKLIENRILDVNESSLIYATKRKEIKLHNYSRNELLELIDNLSDLWF